MIFGVVRKPVLRQIRAEKAVVFVLCGNFKKSPRTFI